MLGRMHLLLVLLAAVTLCALASVDARDELTFRYEPRWAAGVKGEITIRYAPTSCEPSRAIITADLDFSRVSPRALQKVDPRCPRRVREFEWHIHVKWSAPHSSAAFEQCSAHATGSHYDPDRACGPSSEFVNTRFCANRNPLAYRCTPETYRGEPSTCERGDLSGKLGNLLLDRDLRATGRWIDPFFPKLADVSPEWSIVLHPVCGRRSPPRRLVCAVVQTRSSRDDRVTGYN